MPKKQEKPAIVVSEKVETKMETVKKQFLTLIVEVVAGRNLLVYRRYK